MVNIFVGNLAFSVRVEQLRALFEQFGKVDRAHIPFDRQSRRSRGFAFIEMPDRPDAQRAIAALQGVTIEGRAILVREAEERAPASPAAAPPTSRPDPRRDHEAPARTGYTNTRRGVSSLPPGAGC